MLWVLYLESNCSREVWPLAVNASRNANMNRMLFFTVIILSYWSLATASCTCGATVTMLRDNDIPVV